MSKLERLLNLTAVLLDTERPLTSRELQEKVPGYPEGASAFKRAFERDKDDLREMGIPVDVAPIPGRYPPREGYRIPKDQYYLRDPGLDADELAALHLAASAVRLEGIASGIGLAKLGGDPGQPRPVNEIPLPEVAALPASPALVALFDAASSRRQARFGYHGTERLLDPYRLDYQRGRWYVTGFDHVRGEERVFRIDRVEGDVTLGDPGAFDPPSTEVPGIRRQPWELGEGEPVEAQLLVDAEQAGLVRQMVGDDHLVESRPDGSVLVRLPVVNRDAFRSFALGFLDHAEVVGPPELRQDVVSWLEAIAR